MRFTIKDRDNTMPRYGTKRLVTKFLILPKILPNPTTGKDEFRWLTRCSWIQEVDVASNEDDCYKFWRTIEWLA